MTTFAHVVAFTFASSLLSLSLNGASQQNSKTTEAGQIIEIKCSAYLKKPNDSTETKLDPEREKRRKLYAKESVKCVGEGYLKVEIYGRSLDVDQSHGWYPIPERNKGDDAAPGPGRVGSLKGTYRLFPAGTRNPDSLATGQVPDEWLRSFNTPDEIAIELNGKTVTLATSIAPKFSFEADGREYQETSSKGQTIKSLALIEGQQLTVKSSTGSNRTLETVLSPQVNGDLKLIRRLYAGDEKPPTVAEAVYHRISELARFDDVYSSPEPAGEAPYRKVPFESDRFVAELNERISAGSVQEGDKFTVTVGEPPEYKGATVKGHVSSVRRSSKGIELALRFDSIHLADGKSYRFAGTIEQVGDGDTLKAVGRAGIGTSVGAIIGAISGGGKGAAIGAAIGGGIPTSSIHSTGTGDFELKKGTKIIIGAVRLGPKI